jgi:hypothetical protein
MGSKLVAVHRVLGPIDGAGYVSLLKEALLPVLPSALSTAFRKIVFQHDNAPAHRSMISKEFISRTGLKVFGCCLGS